MRAASRRAFLAGAAGAFAAAACDARAAAAGRATQAAPFYANLIHVSYNMWADRKPEGWGMLPKDQLSNVTYAPYLRCEDTAWNELLKASAEAGINLILMDLGDAIQYESHPEIAVKNAWSRDRLRDELSRMRKLGLEPIPKLNFSAAHDTWLGPYKRMVSTPTYYQVCRDLIREVIALYDAPRFFHLGYDEETAANQAGDDLVVVRQHELWWHDFNFFVDAVRSGGSRPWIWSDYAWKHGPDFYTRCPKSVLQSNWYYGTTFRHDERGAETYIELEKAGFEQAPTCSNWEHVENIGKTFDFAADHIDPSRLKGFVLASWKPTLAKFQDYHLEGIRAFGEAIKGRKR
ncbi:MAG TPA: hypothetical protein VK797_00895 [Tepidisphaeraceae bacterium]|jgi:hypothetical protein|nr:hypothetical protein [Tepidisphaeraceae bacterium]